MLNQRIARLYAVGLNDAVGLKTAPRRSGRLHSLIRLLKAFPPQINSRSTIYHYQIISIFIVFYPLLPSIIAFSRRSLYLLARLPALLVCI
jgi:hypothetical protein